MAYSHRAEREQTHVQETEPGPMGPTQWQIQDFPEEGAPTPEGSANILFDQFFSKHCMKIKKFWPRGRVPSVPP